MINIKNLNKEYLINKEKIKVLDNISLTLPSRGMIAILGNSGAGKTTLLNIIAGLDNKVSGEVIINNKNILRFNEKRLCNYRSNEIGYLFQHVNLFTFLNIKENIEIPSFIASKTINKKNEIIKRVKLDKYLHKKVSDLSGGQKQRVALARALINDPNIILCDEPTGALDLTNAHNVMNILKECANEKLVIMVTHNHDLALQYCDRIIYISDGKIVEDKLINFITSQNKKKKRKFINPFMKVKFIFSYAIKYLKIKAKRTIITALSASIALLGIILSMSLGQGFKSYFTYELKQYQKYEGVYITKQYKDELQSIKIEDLIQLSRSSNLTYGCFVNLGDTWSVNQVKINNYDSGLDVLMLGYTLIYELENLNYNEIALIVNQDYLSYLGALLRTIDTVEEVNKKLIQNSINLNFSFQNEFCTFNKNLTLKKIKLSNDNGIYFYHSKDDFVYQLFNTYPLSYNPFEDKFTIISYLKTPLIEDNNKLTKERKYEYHFNQKIIKDYIICNVYYATFYRFLHSEAELMFNQNKMKGYIYSILGGINLDLTFMEATFSNNTKTIEGAKILFKPLFLKTDIMPNSLNEVIISKGLYEELGMQFKYYNKIFNKEITLNVVDIIDEEEKIIYQNSNWSYYFFKDGLSLQDYEIQGIGLIYFIKDNNGLEKTIDELIIKYPYYDIFCPLKEIMNTLDEILNIIITGISSLSIFSIIISSLLIGVITFVNVVEETRNIGILRILGLSRKEIAMIFIIETLLTGLLAFIITLLFSYLITGEINIIFNAMLGTNEELVVLEVSNITLTLQILLIISFLSGLLPSLYASFLPPLKAIKKR